jgi:hypothetical protein
VRYTEAYFVTGEDGLFFLGTNTQARLDSFFVKKEAPSNAHLKRPAPAAGKGKDTKKAKSSGAKGAPGRPKGK